MAPVKAFRFERCLACLFAVGSVSATEVRPGRVSPDCGESAVYTFLRLNRVETDLDSIMSHVTQSSEEGMSFAELQAIARANGVKTEGIRVVALADLPRLPMIAALRHDDEGHFIVIHPIDGSPTLVQIYDQTAEPKIIHIDHLISNSHWTGRVLVKKRSIPTTTQVGILGTCAVILAGFALVSKKRNPLSSS